VRRLAVALVVLLVVPPLQAQIISVPNRALSRQPQFVVGVTAGIQALQGVYDGSTGTAWDFGQTVDFGASLEKSLGRGSAVGVAGAYSRVPLRYFDADDVSSGGGGDDAHADVITAAAQFTAGGGEGFHQLIQVSAGVIMFRNFTLDDGGAVPPRQDIDPRLSIGYGFGYGFSARAEGFIMQEYAVALHQGEGLSGDDRRQYQQQTTRIGLRLGFP
jgi:hypothetical protein